MKDITDSNLHKEFYDFVLDWKLKLAQELETGDGKFDIAYAHVANIRLEFKKRFAEYLTTPNKVTMPFG